MKKIFTLMAVVLTAMTASAQKTWDFTKWSDATYAALKADAAASKLTGWSDIEKKATAEADGAPTDISKDNCFWFTGEANTDGTLSANSVVIEELKGLNFSTSTILGARSLAIAVNYQTADASKSFGPYQGASYLWLGSKNAKSFTIPNVAAGSTITMGVESHKITDARGIQLKQGDTQIGDDFTPTTFDTHTWTVENAGDVDVYSTAGCHIYTITVTEPGSSTAEQLIATLDASTNTGTNDGSTWNFKDGYTITNELGNRNYSDDGKYMTIGKVTASAARYHKINVPSDVTVSAIEIEGYTNNDAATSYSYLYKINDVEYDEFHEANDDPIIANRSAKYGFPNSGEKNDDGTQKGSYPQDCY